jgi:hypothetical protein
MVLAPGQLLNLEHAAGIRIASRAGSVWITQDGDPRDIVLDAGEAFELDRDSPVIVQAIETAVVTLEDPAATARPRRRSWSDALRAATQPFAQRPAWA